MDKYETDGKVNFLCIFWYFFDGRSWGKYCCSIAKLCPILCGPMNCSTPGFPVFHHLPEFAQTHVHWLGIKLLHLNSSVAYILEITLQYWYWVSSCESDLIIQSFHLCIGNTIMYSEGISSRNIRDKKPFCFLCPFPNWNVYQYVGKYSPYWIGKIKATLLSTENAWSNFNSYKSKLSLGN